MRARSRTAPPRPAGGRLTAPTLSYEPGVSHRGVGGESALLDELERLGLRCEASSQLVCVCGLCGRPATKQCYVCTIAFCEFCTRRAHWKARRVAARLATRGFLTP